jgi:hypothetical protein
MTMLTDSQPSALHWQLLDEDLIRWRCVCLLYTSDAADDM